MAVASCGGRLSGERLQASRQELLRAAWAAHAFAPNREVTLASHVCALRVDGQWFTVLDVQELIKGSVVPRGANSIIVLDPEFKLVTRLVYATERPLFCVDNRLYVWGDLQIEQTATEGSELTFSDHARLVTARHVEANAFPAPPGKSPPRQ